MSRQKPLQPFTRLSLRRYTCVHNILFYYTLTRCDDNALRQPLFSNAVGRLSPSRPVGYCCCRSGVVRLLIAWLARVSCTSRMGARVRRQRSNYRLCPGGCWSNPVPPGGRRGRQPRGHAHTTNAGLPAVRAPQIDIGVVGEKYITRFAMFYDAIVGKPLHPFSHPKLFFFFSAFLANRALLRMDLCRRRCCSFGSRHF